VTGLALVLAGAVFRSGGRDPLEAAALATLGVISAAGVAAVRLLILDRILGAVRPSSCLSFRPFSFRD